METVSVQIPADLFSAIYARYQEETSEEINRCLKRLLNSAVSEPTSRQVEGPRYSRPRDSTRPTGRVWEIADRLSKNGSAADRGSVVTACVEAGININTANTQYSHWRKSVP